MRSATTRPVRTSRLALTTSKSVTTSVMSTGLGTGTSTTCCLPFPMMPKFWLVAIATRCSKNGLNFTLYPLNAVL